MKTELPIACTLTEPDLKDRRNTVLQKIVPSILERRELEDGFAYRFPTEDDWLVGLNEFIRYERQCCPFLRFVLIVEPDNGPLWLELRGPASTKEFLASLFS